MLDWSFYVVVFSVLIAWYVMWLFDHLIGLWLDGLHDALDHMRRYVVID